jgi:hypothetical protein
VIDLDDKCTDAESSLKGKFNRQDDDIQSLNVLLLSLWSTRVMNDAVSCLSSNGCELCWKTLQRVDATSWLLKVDVAPGREGDETSMMAKHARGGSAWCASTSWLHHQLTPSA